MPLCMLSFFMRLKSTVLRYMLDICCRKRTRRVWRKYKHSCGDTQGTLVARGRRSTHPSANHRRCRLVLVLNCQLSDAQSLAIPPRRLFQPLILLLVVVLKPGNFAHSMIRCSLLRNLRTNTVTIALILFPAQSRGTRTSVFIRRVSLLHVYPYNHFCCILRAPECINQKYGLREAVGEAPRVLIPTSWFARLGRHGSPIASLAPLPGRAPLTSIS